MNRIQIAAVVVMLGIGNASAQVVQLPSFRTFSYSGSVLVPDSGSAYLGGVNRSAISSQRRGFGGRGFGRSLGQSSSASSAVVSATIIDLDEMDREIRSADISAGIHRDAVLRAAMAAKAQEEGKQLVRFARHQYRAGKLSSSRNAYQVAISVLDGQLKQLAIAEYRLRMNF